jgi:hypothetical protein
MTRSDRLARALGTRSWALALGNLKAKANHGSFS